MRSVDTKHNMCFLVIVFLCVMLTLSYSYKAVLSEAVKYRLTPDSCNDRFEAKAYTMPFISLSVPLKIINLSSNRWTYVSVTLVKWRCRLNLINGHCTVTFCNRNFNLFIVQLQFDVTWVHYVISLPLRSSFFWDVTQRRLVFSYRRFGTTYKSCRQGSRMNHWPDTYFSIWYLLKVYYLQLNALNVKQCINYVNCLRGHFVLLLWKGA
jgi:hypothetical protein